MWSWYKGLYKGRAWYTKTIAVLCSLIVAFILYLVAVDVNFLWLFGKSPGLNAIMNPVTAEASEIYSADGKLIGKYFNENRTPVKYEEVNPAFFKALIDTEDERFYKHFGIDPIGIFGAAKDALVHHDGRGASTITPLRESGQAYRLPHRVGRALCPQARRGGNGHIGGKQHVDVIRLLLCQEGESEKMDEHHHGE